MNFHITLSPTADELGQKAAAKMAEALNAAIEERGSARFVFATGGSQFETVKYLLTHDVDWSKVEVFHLDEYIGLPESHPASFRKYLKERFLAYIHVKAAYPIDGEGDVDAVIAELTAQLHTAPVDVAMIGIGENAHIAFNDPPAQFDSDAAFLVVELDEGCKNQQVREGWFPSLDAVPTHAISMSPKQILASRTIVSAVPHAAKAKAVLESLTRPVDPMVPATILKTHCDWHLFLDDNSAAQVFPL